MPSCLRKLRPFFCLVLLHFSLSAVAYSEDFSAIVENVKFEFEPKMTWFTLNVDINYKLSPIAKQALQKGIPLTWKVIIKVKKQGVFWDTTVQQIEIVYQIQNHALLNLYSVKKTDNGETEVFSTLRAAFNFMSKIQQLPLIAKQSLAQDSIYYVAIKALFNRETLPVPLRPMSYFNSQWALSSQWSRWQLQN